MKVIKLFVFDYGRTLFDRERNMFFEDAFDVLFALSKQYRLAIVSYSKQAEIAERKNQLKDFGMYKLFEEIVFTSTPEGKNDAYAELSESAGVPINNMVIVDDYIIRGIAWGNRNGATTYWYKNGKFADIAPTSQTGTPTHTISSLSEIISTL